MKTAIIALATLVAGASAAYAQTPAQNKLKPGERGHEQRQAAQDAAFHAHQQKEHDLALQARKTGDTKTLARVQNERAADQQHLDKLHAQKAADAQHVKNIYNKTN